VYLAILITEFLFWLSINPRLSLLVTQAGQYAKVEASVHLGTRRFPVSRTKEANWIMASVITELADTFDENSQREAVPQ
jgi:NAD(P)H-flavin reductase